MINVLIFGKGIMFDTIVRENLLSNEINIVGFIDNNLKEDGVYLPSQVCNLNYDKILISLENSNSKLAVIEQLIDLGVELSKIGIIEEYIPFHNYSINVIEKGVVQVNKNNLHIRCNNAIELMIVEEVFGEAMYDFYDKHKKIVIDIGMNIGSASLMFASKDDVEAVYSFEIDKFTFERAQQNIKLNDEAIQNKLHIYNVGLGKEDTLERYYFHKTETGKSAGMKKCINEECYSQDTVEIEVRKASSALKDIISNYNGKIVMKIDCEGAEYEIFEELKASGLLKKIDVILGEWHDGRKAELLNLLQEDNEFFCIVQSQRRCLGLFYAFRNENNI